jgi:hypothetical protein
MSPGRVRLTAFILRELVRGRALRLVRVGGLSSTLPFSAVSSLR